MTPEQRQEQYWREQQAAEERRFHQSQSASQSQWQQEQAWQRQQSDREYEWQRYQAQEQWRRDQARYDEEKQLASRGRASDRNQRISALDAAIAAARSRAGAGEGELTPRYGEIDALRGYQEAGARRADQLGRANMRAEVTGSGLGLSGIREGQEARKTADLLGKLGGINLSAGQQKDALTRQIAKIRSELAAQVSQSEAEKRSIQQNAY